MEIFIHVSWEKAVAMRSEPGTRPVPLHLEDTERWTEARLSTLLRLVKVSKETRGATPVLHGPAAHPGEALVAFLDEEIQRTEKEKTEHEAAARKAREKADQDLMAQARSRAISIQQGQLPQHELEKAVETLRLEEGGHLEEVHIHVFQPVSSGGKLLEYGKYLDPADLARLDELIVEINEERRRTARATLLKKHQDRAKAEAKQAALAAFPAFVRTVLSTEQLERFEAGVLPSKEKMAAVEDWIFRQLLDPAEAPYQFLRNEDIGEHHHECRGNDPTFGAYDASEVPAETWARFKALKARLPTPPPEWSVSCVLRDHEVHCAGCPSYWWQDIRHRFGCRIDAVHVPTEQSWSRELSLEPPSK
jgi:hypothetical protein